MKPIVSVVIPVYNIEGYIEKCLKSIVNQTYKNIEIIVVNDGSTDKSQNIIDSFKALYGDKIISICQKNAGQSVARNVGVSRSSGEYIAFIDGDDYVESDYIEKLILTAEKEQAEVVVCGYKRVNTCGQILSIHNVVGKKGEGTNGKIGIGVVWGQLFSKKLLQRYNFRFAAGKIYEDSSYSIKARMLAEKVYFIENVSYNYVIHSESTMNKSRVKSARFPLKEFEEDIREIKENISTEREELFEYEIIQFFAGFLLHFCRKAPIEDVQILCKYCRRILKNYFPYYWKNKYIGFNQEEITMVQRLAVLTFVLMCRCKMDIVGISLITRV